jgi:MSHA pilin protein MshC
MELVMVVVILGVLSVTALPMLFNRTDFEARGYFDELLQATRYAQKLAVSTNCDVLVTIATVGTTSTYTLALLATPADHPQCAAAPVGLPGSPPPYVSPAGVTVTAGTGTITFHPSGLATMGLANPVTVNDTLSMQVHPATGYVERL